MAEAKRAERERRLAERRKRARLRTALFVAVAAIVFVGCAALYNSDIFPVKTVEVTGVQNLTVEHVLELAQVPEDATLLRFPKDEVRERVEADPWVARVAVTRDFPDTMRIRVEEREPIALVDMLDEYLVVDAEGFVIEKRSLATTDTALVVIRDIEGLDPSAGRKTSSEPLLNALAVYRSLSDELKAQLRAISAPSIDETALLTNDGIEVFVGKAEDMEKKDAVIREIIKDQGEGVIFIDVRTVDRPIVRGLSD
ncbi:MAG: hypothetical protein Kow0056_01000 [Coriobacteriia bacterium]